LNVLEHVFEPIKILENARSLLRPGGVLIAATPCVWPIHNYPIDCARLLPDWYRRYAQQKGLPLLGGRTDEFGSNGTDCFPPDRRMIGWRGVRSCTVHKLFQHLRSWHALLAAYAVGVAFKAAT
jgi:SAM-dependent methyltransferase